MSSYTMSWRHHKWRRRRVFCICLNRPTFDGLSSTSSISKTFLLLSELSYPSLWTYTWTLHIDIFVCTKIYWFCLHWFSVSKWTYQYLQCLKSYTKWLRKLWKCLLQHWTFWLIIDPCHVNLKQRHRKLKPACLACNLLWCFVHWLNLFVTLSYWTSANFQK